MARHVLALLGLDAFTAINDKHGQLVANSSLKILGERALRLCAQHGCLSGRVSGDTLGFWLAHPKDQAQVDRFLDDVRALVATPVVTDYGVSIAVGGTTGVYFHSADDQAVPDPILAAEIVLKNTKRENKGGIGYFSERGYRLLQDKTRMIDDIQSALAKGEFSAWYQPIFDARTKLYTGVEALVRWHHPQLGLLAPARFLPLVAEIGKSRELGQFMLAQACRDAASLLRDGLDVGTWRICEEERLRETDRLEEEHIRGQLEERVGVACRVHRPERDELASQRGKVVLIFFGYSFCPDVCPTTLSKLTTVAQQLGEDRDKVKTLYITVDPERDNPQRLASYLKGFDASFVGGTGEPAQLTAIRQRYGVVANKVVASAAHGGYAIDHSSSVFMIDREGRLRGRGSGVALNCFSIRSFGSRRARAGRPAGRWRGTRWPAHAAAGEEKAWTGREASYRARAGKKAPRKGRSAHSASGGSGFILQRL